MKTTRQHRRDAAAKHSGKETVVRVPWMLKRLRNQAVKFFAGKDRELAAQLRADLQSAHSYGDVRSEIVTRIGRSPWEKFMDRFVGHRINKHA